MVAAGAQIMEIAMGANAVAGFASVRGRSESDGRGHAPLHDEVGHAVTALLASQSVGSERSATRHKEAGRLATFMASVANATAEGAAI